MKKTVFLLTGLVILLSCKVNKSQGKAEETPSCITKAIESFSKGTCEKGINVKEYTFQGISVYVFDPGNCGNDMTSEVFDKNCKSLGYLGGFTGNVKINGEDFSHAIFMKTVWEK